MSITSSILAGEILLIMEHVSGAVRIVDFERALHASKRDINFAIGRLMAEELIELIHEDERNVIILKHNLEMYGRQYAKNDATLR